MKTAAGRRRFTYLRGRGAERLALIWLMLKGYRPLARRFSAQGGEIDLIMRRGDTVAFVEVKARERWRWRWTRSGPPRSAVSAAPRGPGYRAIPGPPR